MADLDRALKLLAKGRDPACTDAEARSFLNAAIDILEALGRIDRDPPVSNDPEPPGRGASRQWFVWQVRQNQRAGRPTTWMPDDVAEQMRRTREENDRWKAARDEHRRTGERVTFTYSSTSNGNWHFQP